MILVLILCVAVSALGWFGWRLRDRFSRRLRRGPKKLRYFAIDLAKDDGKRRQKH